MKQIIQKLTPALDEPKFSPRHLFKVIDVSGSMYGELDEIGRLFVINTLRELNPNDKLTVIWFSGRGQAGKIIDRMTIDTLDSIEKAAEGIRKWLRPVGMTSFQTPFEIIEQSLRDDDMKANLVFMSDGMDNQSNRVELLQLVQKLAPRFETATIVEYGDFADRKLLNEMAEIFNGQRLQVETPEQFTELLTETSGGVREKMITVLVDPDVIHTTYYDSQLNPHIVFPHEGAIQVPETTSRLYHFYGLDMFDGKTMPELEGTVVLISHLAVAASRMNPKLVDATLRKLGDVELIKDSATLFGKQRYAEFEAKVRERLNGNIEFYQQGFDPTVMPHPNAVTVPQILDALADGVTELKIEQPYLKPTRISRKRHVYTYEEQKAKILANPDSKGLDELMIRSKASAEFHRDRRSSFPILEVITHKERANLSLMVVIPGVVQFAQTDHNIPERLDSKQFRTFNAVFDGVVTIPSITFKPSVGAKEKLKGFGLELVYDHEGFTTLDLKSFPMANRGLVESVSAQEFAIRAVRVQKILAELKVWKDARNKLFPPATSEGLAVKYGKEAAEWLRTVGVTDHGFNPARLSDEPTDALTVNELYYVVEGTSKLPKIEAVEKKIEENKLLNKADQLIYQGLKSLKAINPQKKEEFDFHIKALNAELKMIRSRIEDIRFAVLVGGAWFSDLPPEGFIDVDEYRVTIGLREKEIAI